MSTFTITIIIIIAAYATFVVWHLIAKSKPTPTEKAKKHLDTETLLLQHNAPDNRCWLVTRQDQDRHTIYAYAPTNKVSTNRIESFFQTEAIQPIDMMDYLITRVVSDEGIHRIVIQDRPARMFAELRYRNSANYMILSEKTITDWLFQNIKVTA